LSEDGGRAHGAWACPQSKAASHPWRMMPGARRRDDSNDYPAILRMVP
jgi:hypothetical protein